MSNIYKGTSHQLRLTVEDVYGKLENYYIHWLLKPQDSFGEFEKKKILDLQKVQEIIAKHHQTFLQLFWMPYCNAILPSGKLSLCT